MSALRMPNWDQLAVDRPVMVATMGRYLEQVACTLRPGSVGGADQALRCFAAFLAEAHPKVRTVAAVGREHIENVKTGTANATRGWLMCASAA